MTGQRAPIASLIARGRVELVDVPLDRAPAARLVGESLTDDPAGQVHA